MNKWLSSSSVISFSICLCPNLLEDAHLATGQEVWPSPVLLLAQGLEPSAKARQYHGLIHPVGAEPTNMHVQESDGSRACWLSWVSLPCLCGDKWAIRFPKRRHEEHRSAG